MKTATDMTQEDFPEELRHYKLAGPLCLVGLPGCGKSSVGRKLAALLDVPFVDVDSNIEVMQGARVAEIFESQGEEAFRLMEREMIAYFLHAPKPMVMATGGGAYISPVTRKILNENTLTVWIKPSFDIVLERVSRRNHRPLLEQGDKKKILTDLMNKRYPVYEEADVKVETEAGSHHEAALSIIRELIAHG